MLSVCLPGALSSAAPPSVMLWAWERPGDLRALPKNAGVAFLASSIYLRDGSTQVVPRFQPLRLPSGTYRMAVIRIESLGSRRLLTPSQRMAAVQALTDTIR